MVVRIRRLGLIGLKIHFVYVEPTADGTKVDIK